MVTPQQSDPPSDDVARGRAPRWVKAFWLVAAALVLAFAALHAAGRGFRHDHAPAVPQPGERHP